MSSIPWSTPLDANRPWWMHESWSVIDGRLHLDGTDLAELAGRMGTPLHVYSGATFQRQVLRIQSALSALGLRHRVFYAMKANRCPEVLEIVRDVPGTGVDTCSPRELERALQVGFHASAVSFNAGMASNRDLDAVATAGVSCILDSYSALRRYGERVPRDTPVGLRFNPGVHVGYQGSGSARAAYGNGKFGFEPEELPEALRVARLAGLRVDLLHLHIGWGLPASAEGAVNEAFRTLALLARKVEGLRAVNVGGGLGGRFQQADQPLALRTWAELASRHLGPLDVEVCCEPGTFVAAPAGALLVEVNTVEERRGTCWVGVNAGYVQDPCPAVYGIPVEVIPLENALAPPIRKVTVAGHINEAYDLWAVDRLMPFMREGDLLALTPTGAYGASMSSDHCMRGQPREITLR